MHRTAKLRRTFGVIGVVLGLSVLAGGAMAAPGAGPGHHGGARDHQGDRGDRGQRAQRPGGRPQVSVFELGTATEALGS